MYSQKRQLGNIGEDAACVFLERKGYKIVRRNYLKPWGEIDIIAIKSDTVRFIEVKTLSRESPIYGVTREREVYTPEEQVHPAKLKKIARTAETYMNETGDRRDYQIDVVGVYLDHANRKAQCRLFEQVL